MWEVIPNYLDVKMMRAQYEAINPCDFGIRAEENITVMTDNSTILPTYDNIMKHLHSMADRTNTENIKELFITYSGHGSNIYDHSGDESDKRDECLIPLDHKTKGYIKDDDLQAVLAKINEKVKVIVLI